MYHPSLPGFNRVVSNQMGNDWKHKARELIESQRGQRQKVEYTLKLEVEQEEQELGQIRAHHAKSIEGCADEYDRFKNEHAAHTIIQDVHHLQSQVHQLEATQQALLSYIKFGELRYIPNH